MEVNEIKIGEKYRMMSGDKDVKGKVVIVKAIKPSSYIKIELPDGSLDTVNPSSLAELLVYSKYQKIYNLHKELEEYEDDFQEAIESVLKLLNKGHVFDLTYEFNYEEELLHITGTDIGHYSVSFSFPLKYLYEENWYEEMIKEQEEEKRKKEELKKKKLEEESKEAEIRIEEHEKKEYLRLKAKFEDSDS